jgi:hypothetical protein
MISARLLKVIYRIRSQYSHEKARFSQQIGIVGYKLRQTPSPPLSANAMLASSTV